MGILAKILGLEQNLRHKIDDLCNLVDQELNRSNITKPLRKRLGPDYRHRLEVTSDVQRTVEHVAKFLEQIVTSVGHTAFRKAHGYVAIIHARLAKYKQLIGEQQDSKYLSDIALSRVLKSNDDELHEAVSAVAALFLEMAENDSELDWDVLSVIRYERAARLYSLLSGSDDHRAASAWMRIDGIYKKALDRFNSAVPRGRTQPMMTLAGLLAHWVPNEGTELYEGIMHAMRVGERDSDNQVRASAQQGLAYIASARERMREPQGRQPSPDPVTAALQRAIDRGRTYRDPHS